MLISRPHSRRSVMLLATLLVSTPPIALVAIGLGPVPTSPGTTAAVLFDALRGLPPAHEQALIVTEIRLPRVLLAGVAGAGLALAGAAMQAYFRNPLAEPGVTGIGSGAALGAVMAIASGSMMFGTMTVTVAAFVGALAVLTTIHVIALWSRDRSPVTVLLLGIALNAFCGALTGLVIANAADSQTVRGALFWLQGDLTATAWNDLATAAIPVCLAGVLLVISARELNTLMLGDTAAHSVGMNVRRTRTMLLLLTSILVGATVAVTGVIGFVGLVAPHVVRLLVGSDHTVLLPGSALLGACFLIVADTVTRLAPVGTSWQTGVVAALVGSPLFLALVIRSRAQAGVGGTAR